MMIMISLRSLLLYYDADYLKSLIFIFSSLQQVRDLVEKCTCPSQFPMIRVSEGKYRIGDTKVLIFVRVSRQKFTIQPT